MEEQKQAEQQWNKIRRERINILKEAPSEENLWQAVMAFQDYPFKTVTGLPDKYQISAQRRSLITMASALHDIGKIGIDDKILNKPGRLTPEEFDEMKKHTIIGESILKNVGIYQNEELVQLAMQICRWHHERYDGRGYPDGLKGEEIPIEVQVVSIADVYDALVSERVYKKAYSHKKAVEMILNGECGQFNPLLLECLQDIQDRIDEEFQNVENQSEEENQERKVHDQIMETTVLG